MSDVPGDRRDGATTYGGQRSMVRERLLEAAIDDIFEVLADQPFLDEKDRLDPMLVASAKRTAVRVMSDPTPEETAEFWGVYAALILAVEQHETAVATPVPAVRPVFLAVWRRWVAEWLGGWTPALSGQVVGGAVVAIAATIIVYSVFQGRPVATPTAGGGQIAAAGQLHVPGNLIDNAALPMVGVLAGDIDPGLAAAYVGSHEGYAVPGTAMADEGFGYGDVYEPPAMEPVRLLPNAEPDPIASVPAVHRSTDEESVSFAADHLAEFSRPGA